MKNRRRWPWILLGFVLGLPILLAGCCLLWIRMSFGGEGAKLDDAIAEARRQNISTTPTELRAISHLSEASNGADLYRSAFSELKSASPKGIDQSVGHLLSGEATREDEAAVRAYLNTCEPSIHRLELASRKKGADWDYRWEEGIMLLYPEMAELKRATKLVCARALLRSRDGNVARAFEDLQTAAATASSAAGTPTLIGVLVQIATSLIVLNATEIILREHHDSSTLHRARKLISKLATPNLARGYEGELVLSRQAIQSLEKTVAEMRGQYNEPVLDRFPDSYLIRDPNFRRAIETWTVRFWIKAVSAARQPDFSPEQRAATAGLDAQLGSETSLAGRVAAQLFPVLGLSADAISRLEAQRRALLGSLDVFAAGVPTHFTSKQIDPFTGKPLIYVKKNGGFRLYSVGPNLADDGGITRREASKKGLPSDKTDVGAVFEMP